MTASIYSGQDQGSGRQCWLRDVRVVRFLERNSRAFFRSMGGDPIPLTGHTS